MQKQGYGTRISLGSGTRISGLIYAVDIDLLPAPISQTCPTSKIMRLLYEEFMVGGFRM